MHTNGYFKTLDFLINLCQEPEAACALGAFLLNRNTNDFLTINEMEIASYSQYMETMQIFLCSFVPAVSWRDFYNLHPEKMLFNIGSSLSSQVNFRGTFKFSNKVFMQSLLATMLCCILIGENSGIINHNPPDRLGKIEVNPSPADITALEILYTIFITVPGIFLYIALMLPLPALALTYANLKLIVAADTIGATTPLHRAIMNDDKHRFEALLFKGANMYKLDNKNKRLDELQPENATIKLQDYNYRLPSLRA